MAQPGGSGSGTQTPWAQAIDAAGYNLGDLGKLSFDDEGVEIASGVATITKGFVAITGEGFAADDLHTISATTNGLLVLFMNDDITLKASGGNIRCPSGVDTLIAENSIAVLAYYASAWNLLKGQEAGAAHSSNHTDGTDDIQDATASQKGLATAAQIAKLDGIDAVASVKSNLSASTDPAAGDDTGDGYAVGSIWINTTLDKVWRCVDNSAAAAVWRCLSHRYEALEVVLDGGGSAITTGVKAALVVPVDCEIEVAEALSINGTSGSIQVDVWKDSYANHPPTDADSIVASAPIAISSGTKSQDSTLTGWTKSLSKGDILIFNVDSCTTIDLALICLRVLAR